MAYDSEQPQVACNGCLHFAIQVWQAPLQGARHICLIAVREVPDGCDNYTPAIRAGEDERKSHD